jgi:hypothetical protein
METIKLTQEELTQLTEFKKTNDNLIWEFGQIEMNLSILETQKNDLKERLNKTNKDQNEFAKTLNTKYGNGSIKMETGEFIPTQN